MARTLMLAAFVCVLSACKLERNSIELTSDTGDYIGASKQYTYSNKNAIITLTTDAGQASIRIEGDEYWSGDFQLPAGYEQLQPGSYAELTRYPFHDPAAGGLSWHGEGRGCNTLTGWLIIDKADYSNDGKLAKLEMNFEQHCEGAVPALHGKIKWYATDKTLPPEPVNPAPANLWQPAADVLPTGGNYLYLESESGDYIGQGQSYLHIEDGNTFTVSSSDGFVSLSVGGWYGRFQTMHTLSRLEPGYYGNLQRYPFHNPARGGLSWSGNGRGCNTLSGWFVVDQVNYVGDELTAIDIRFEQHCEGMTPALYGKLHWESGSGAL